MEKRGIETIVGVFILVGLLACAGLVLYFGSSTSSRLGAYKFTVAFPSASGIIKDSAVLMSGVRIGRVIGDPRINETGDRALIQIGLEPGFTIREGSRFSVRESGLLGDRFVEVQPNTNTHASPIVSGSYVEGSRATALGDLTSEAKPIMERAQEAMNKINSILTKLDTEVLTPELGKDLKNAVTKLNSILNRTDNLLAQAEKGQGVLAKLLNDKTMADDLRALIFNLRKRGILFYKDVAATGKETESAPSSER